MEALALLVHGPQVPVQGGFIPLRPPALTRRAAALENVLQLLLARAAAEDGFTQGELRREAPEECRIGWGQHRGSTRGVGQCESVSDDKTGGHGSYNIELRRSTIALGPSRSKRSPTCPNGHRNAGICHKTRP